MLKRALTYLFSTWLLLLFLLPVSVRWIDWSQSYPWLAEAEPLMGYFVAPDSLPLSRALWMEGQYQENAEARIKFEFPYRPWLVRSYNQFKYDYLDEVNARDVVKGKQDYLYEEDYIKAFLGEDFLGEEAIEEKVFKLRKVIDTLAHSNTKVLFIMASGKATYLPEYLPPQYDMRKKGPNNYETFRKYFQQYEVPHIDINHYFLSMKDTVQYPLYPRGGTHWSMYAVWKVADTLLNKVEDLFVRPTVHYFYPGGPTDTIARDADGDIARAANLLHYPYNETLKYRWAELIDKDSSLFRPNTLVIGDSYFWTLYGNFVPDNCFGPDWRFWYYGREIWLRNQREDHNVSAIQDLRREFESRDLILIMIAETNLKGCCMGFVEHAYELYFEGRPLR